MAASASEAVVAATWAWEDRAGLAHTLPRTNSAGYLRQWAIIRRLRREGRLEAPRGR